MNPESSLLNHIIKTRDLITPLNSDVGKSIELFTDEWDFINDYYSKHREVPPLSVFQTKFPNFDVFNTDGSIDFYIEETHQWHARHMLQRIITDAASGLKGNSAYSTITQMQQALAKLGRDTKQVRDLDLVGNREERIESLRERIEIRESGRTILGVPTGITAIDENFGGCQQGDFIVIGGWTGSLKSFLALYMAVNAWLEGYRVMYFSLEMTGLQLGYRFDTLLSGMQGQGFTNTSLTHAENITFDKYKNWLGEIMYDKHPFVVVTNEDLDEVNQNTVLSKIEMWKPDLCILDYHQLFDDASGAQGETEKTKNLSKAFKRIAIKTGTPIIDITSVTMPKGDSGNRPPNLDELAWSKQLAYDSDLTLTLCKHGEALEVVSRKQRRGREFSFYLNWDIDKGIVKELGRDTFRREYIEDED